MSLEAEGRGGAGQEGGHRRKHCSPIHRDFDAARRKEFSARERHDQSPLALTQADAGFAALLLRLSFHDPAEIFFELSQEGNRDEGGAGVGRGLGIEDGNRDREGRTLVEEERGLQTIEDVRVILGFCPRIRVEHDE